jgi:hypothetical protein
MNTVNKVYLQNKSNLRTLLNLLNKAYVQNKSNKVNME